MKFYKLSIYFFKYTPEIVLFFLFLKKKTQKKRGVGTIDYAIHESPSSPSHTIQKKILTIQLKIWYIASYLPLVKKK